MVHFQFIVNKIFYLNFSYDKAIKINPKTSDYWNNKGDALKNLKKYEQALEWFTFSLQLIKFFSLNFSCDKAIEINPKNSNYWNNKGIAFDNINK